jgi:mRNA-degrading endonuclease YafQ of YafQ-DinJ toxin-antitoxin module
MQMVYLKKRAIQDLGRLLIRLMKFKKNPLTQTEAHEYVDEIVEQCYALSNLLVRTQTSNEDHKKYGQYVFRFDKHSRIQWYIIYDFDKYGNIAIKKIISNNRTKAKYP